VRLSPTINASLGQDAVNGITRAQLWIRNGRVSYFALRVFEAICEVGCFSAASKYFLINVRRTKIAHFGQLFGVRWSAIANRGLFIVQIPTL
jgi:hypothetical protein